MNKIQGDYRGKVEWLRVGSIEIEPLAQRALDEKWIEATVPLFDPDLLGKPLVVVISHRGRDRYLAQDGQHRVKLCEAALGPDQLIECEVVRDPEMDLVKAARLFLGRNRKRTVRMLDMHRVGVTAQVQTDVDIDKAVRAAGLRVGAGNGEGVVNAVAALRSVYRKASSLGITETLEILKTAFGFSSEHFCAPLIIGVGMVLHRHNGDLDRKRLRHQLSKKKATNLVGDARALRDVMGGSLGQNVAKAVITLYNVGLRKDRLPEWGTRSVDAE